MANKAETAPQTPRFGIESGSSEHQPQPVNRESCISMFTTIQQQEDALAEVKSGRTMPCWLAIEDKTTPQVAAATPNVCEGEDGIVKCSETIVNPATRIGNGGEANRKRGAATVGVVDCGAKAAKYIVVQSLRHTGLHLPADFSTPDQFGCTKCRMSQIGCGKCRSKKDWKLSYRIYSPGNKVELEWSRCSEEDINEL